MYLSQTNSLDKISFTSNTISNVANALIILPLEVEKLKVKWIVYCTFQLFCKKLLLLLSKWAQYAYPEIRDGSFRCTLWTFKQQLTLKVRARCGSSTYPEIVPLSALIACNAMNWPGGAALYFSHKFHHWLMLYTLGQYIVNVQWSTDRWQIFDYLHIWDTIVLQ